MNEKAPSSDANFEGLKITDEMAVEALRNRDSDPAAKAVFEKWLDQLIYELDAIYKESGPESLALSLVEYSIRQAIVYYKAGYVDKAKEDIANAVDAAASQYYNGTGLYEKACEIQEKMEEGEGL